MTKNDCRFILDADGSADVATDWTTWDVPESRFILMAIGDRCESTLPTNEAAE